MITTQLELVLTHSSRKNAPSQVELFSKSSILRAYFHELHFKMDFKLVALPLSIDGQL